ncbi:flavin containing amine oxidase [Rhizoctonia solani AG-3 Rhs1AP]|uniref:Flavin containing amine oxidase n=1 Tax=Rhizoctonia solani AG-3 Rhs1AP TaxID=1086054 RepID=X8IW98_9AGAM|nr:L-amino acid oxidase 1 [synthetic construct]EUC54418.1 flavin containing amine oxidase [Rhizoctonia solani AG-3 Rhs1AP]
MSSKEFKDVSFDVMLLHTEQIIKNYHKGFDSVLRQADKTQSISYDKDHKLVFDPETIADKPKIIPGPDPIQFLEKQRVAVIGGGVSGLLIAMRLGRFCKVDVYEASDRLGGRLYTHKFPNGGQWDYFDVGAMRFPKNTVMEPTFRLFEMLGFNTQNGTLLKYQRSSPESWLYYNDIRVKRSEASTEDFGARQSQGGNVPDEWVTKGMKKLMEDVCKRFLDKLKADPRDGYDYLMTYDRYSMRSFMSEVVLEEEGSYLRKERYPTSVINWLETRNFAPGWFDHAFSETILELLAFDDGSANVEWYCVKGGSQRIIDAMEKKLKDDPVLKKNVTIHRSRRVVRVDCHESPDRMEVHWNAPSDRGSRHDYTYVALTVSPQCMRHIDLTTCHLDYGQKSSILMLQPGPSIKVGMRFKNNWWNDDVHKITGGQSSTDRPVRNVVYPSYGSGESKTLIASYCWTQDAVNLGCWMRENNTFDRQQLQDVIIADLAVIHGIDPKFLQGQLEDMYPFDWTNNPNTKGAYALFGPGQFESLLPNLTRSAARGRLYFAGEAISTCHGWVAGSVDSADRVVLEICIHMCLEYIRLGYPLQDFPWPWGTAWTNSPEFTGQPPAADAEGEVLYTMFNSELTLKQLAISEALQGGERKEI